MLSLNLQMEGKKMFKSLYVWEIKKMISLKGVIILLAVAILSLILSNFVFSLTDGVNIQQDPATPFESSQESDDITNNFDIMEGFKLNESEAKIALIAAKLHLEEVRENTVKDRNFYRGMNDEIYQAQAMVTFLEYLIDNELYDTSVMPYMGSLSNFMLSLVKPSVQGFMTLYLSLMSIAILIYGIVCGANAYGKEIKKGTLKMVMIRPISRDKLTLSKLLAALTVATAFFLGAILIAFIFGSIAYENTATTFIYIFNAKSAFSASSNLSLLIIIGTLLIQIWSYAAFAMAISTISKNAILGITIPAIIGFGITLLIFAQLGLARFLFSYNAEIMSEFFGISPSIYGGSNFFLSAGLLIAYVSVFVTSTFVIFKKRDIA